MSASTAGKGLLVELWDKEIDRHLYDHLLGVIHPEQEPDFGYAEPPHIDLTGQNSYWHKLRAIWQQTRDPGCACEFCSGTDISTFQRCWNKHFGVKHANSGSSADFGEAKKQIAHVDSPGVMVGFNCRSCGNHNEHATANQNDGTYLCYECRT